MLRLKALHVALYDVVDRSFHTLQNCSKAHPLPLFSSLFGSTNMSAKRPRDSEVPDNHPSIPPPPVGFRQPTMQSGSQMDARDAFQVDARDALPTLTNWGGGRRGSQVEGSAVVSNARLTNEQRSTIQKSVCTYFLQNKSVLLNILFAVHACSFPPH